jgi:hypothetical protein
MYLAILRINAHQDLKLIIGNVMKPFYSTEKWTLLSPPSHIIIYIGQILAIFRPIDDWHEKSFVLSLGDCDGYDCLVYMLPVVRKKLMNRSI